MNRATGLLIIEVCNSNPNGNPDQENEPRLFPDGRGFISPVSFKRKLRDLVELKAGDVWKDISSEFGLRDEEFDILESRGRKRNEIDNMGIPEFLKRYWDARVFGCTFLEKKKEDEDDEGESESGEPDKKSRKAKKSAQDPEPLKKEEKIRTGVVQFGLGVSVCPVEVERSTYTSKSGVQEGKDRGMAPLAYRIVRHGVYVMPYFVNPTAAKKTECTDRDIEVMKKLIPRAYSDNPSMLRSDVRIRHAWHMEHKSPLGSCPDHLLIEAMTPRRNGASGTPSPGTTPVDGPSNSWQNYLAPQKQDLPKDLADRVVMEDLIAQWRTASA